MIWRLISQLTELMPHLMRLVPALERFTGSSAPPELINRLHEGVTTLNESHHALVGQMKDQNLHLAAIEAKLEQQQIQAERLQHGLSELQQRYRSTELRLGLLVALVALLVVAVVVALVVLYVGRH